jgi:hypothetical protein
MTKAERSKWSLTPSQQYLVDKLSPILASGHGMQRPYLLTGDTGVGKTFLALKLLDKPSDYYNLSLNRLGVLLSEYRLRDLTPEVVARFIKELIEKSVGNSAIVDGLDPIVCMWAVDHPDIIPNFFIALSRAILKIPSLVVIRTSEFQLSHQSLQEKGWWPVNSRFHLELTQADKEVVARNWAVDPMKGHISTNLYDLLASRFVKE